MSHLEITRDGFHIRLFTAKPLPEWLMIELERGPCKQVSMPVRRGEMVGYHITLPEKYSEEAREVVEISLRQRLESLLHKIEVGLIFHFDASFTAGIDVWRNAIIDSIRDAGFTVNADPDADWRQALLVTGVDFAPSKLELVARIAEIVRTEGGFDSVTINFHQQGTKILVP